MDPITLRGRSMHYEAVEDFSALPGRLLQYVLSVLCLYAACMSFSRKSESFLSGGPRAQARQCVVFPTRYILIIFSNVLESVSFFAHGAKKDTDLCYNSP